MSVWASSNNRQDGNGDIINNVTEVFIDATTDVNGEISIDLTQLNFVEILDVSGNVLGQVLDTVVNVVDILSVLVVDITTTVVKAVVVLGQSLLIALGETSNSVQRAGAGKSVRIKVTGRR